MSALLACLVGLLAVVAAPDDRESDTVYLADGKSREGRVVYEDDEVLVLRDGSKERVIPLAEIKEVDAVSRHLATLLERLAEMGPLLEQPATALLEQARWADQARLPGEARLLRYAALLVEPDNAAALEALDARERGGQQQVKHLNIWRKVDEFGTGPEKWKERWRFETTHYALESDLPLPQVIAAAFDAERFYAAIFELLTPAVPLREPQELMEVRLHAGETSYPEPGDGRRGFFDPGDRVAELLADGDDALARMLHELTLQFLYQTSEFSPKAKGRVPRWAQVGLAMAFTAGRSGPPGLARHDPLALVPDAVRLHAQAVESDDAYDLDRVLVFGAEDYAAQSEQALKYAQSWTLLHTLLDARDGELRDPFLAFLRSAYEGQGSPTDLEDILGVEEEDLEALWSEHLAELVTRI